MKAGMQINYHYDLKSGEIFVERNIKAYVDGVSYYYPQGRGNKEDKSIKLFGRRLFLVKNKQRVSKLVRLFENVELLDKMDI